MGKGCFLALKEWCLVFLRVSGNPTGQTIRLAHQKWAASCSNIGLASTASSNRLFLQSIHTYLKMSIYAVIIAIECQHYDTFVLINVQVCYSHATNRWNRLGTYRMRRHRRVLQLTVGRCHQRRQPSLQSAHERC